MIRDEHRLPGVYEHAAVENTSRWFSWKNHDPDRSEEAGGGDVIGVYRRIARSVPPSARPVAPHRAEFRRFQVQSALESPPVTC